MPLSEYSGRGKLYKPKLNTMKKLLLLLTILCIYGCSSKKEYTCIVKEHVYDLLGSSYSIKDREPKTILAINDSSAYVQSFQHFCICEAVHQKMVNQGFAKSNKPISFSVYDKEGTLITDYALSNMESIYDSIKQRTYSYINNDTNASVETNANAPKIDSAKIKELLPFFRINKDKFSPEGLTWYKPKDAPQYVNYNGIYCYFAKNTQGRPYSLRLKIQYEADDWLFIKTIYFSIGDKAYRYIPENVERDHGEGRIWEWSDQAFDSNIKEIIDALIIAPSAEIKFSGSQYYNIKKITNRQIKSIKQTIELYKAMGGKY